MNKPIILTNHHDMKTQIRRPMVKQLLSIVLVLGLAHLASCSDDPEATNEEEVVTTVIVTLTPTEGDAIVMTWDDVNLDAIVDESEITTSDNLLASTSYTADIQLLNKSADPDIDITEEVQEEAEDHIFCFTVTGVNIAISNLNKDSNELPLGITSTWTATTQSSGTVNITLRHQPGVKTGDCPGAGDTDASITFPVIVGNPL
jgi:hypothetical protein